MTPFKTNEKKSGSILLRLLLSLGLVCIPLVLLAQIQSPEWWQDRGVQDGNAPANDYAAVNQGQLKNMARAAMLEMDDKLHGEAGLAIHGLVDPWKTSTTAQDYAVVNLGQLKMVAKPFFDRLLEIGYDGHPLQSGTYPWIGLTPNDYAVANIGQVKNLFAFDVPWFIVQSGTVANDRVLNIPLPPASSFGVGEVAYSIVTSPTLGQLVGTPSDDFKYQPGCRPNAGEDSFSYHVSINGRVVVIGTFDIVIDAPPIVYAGTNQNVEISATCLLGGQARPMDISTLSCNWSKVSGSGNVIFSSAMSATIVTTCTAG